MATLTTAPPAAPPAASEVPITDEAQELTEHLESLPVRLELDVLAAVMALNDDGESTEAISNTLKLHPLVVTLEVGRELKRREETPALTAEEWNGLAAGTHVANKQLREMIDTAVRCRPGVSRTSILHDAGINDSCHGNRLLGYKPNHGCTRRKQTIACKHAARIAVALGRAPAEVVGL